MHFKISLFVTDSTNKREKELFVSLGDYQWCNYNVIRGYRYLDCFFFLFNYYRSSYQLLKQHKTLPGRVRCHHLSPHSLLSPTCPWYKALVCQSLWSDSVGLGFLGPPTMLAPWKASYKCLLIQLLNECYLPMLKSSTCLGC